ncbi:MAG: MerR family transcriptional regulator [Acidobacteriota bacterium]|nr:MerR family transcriptional regulator [Acidobacteriota bacterium]
MTVGELARRSGLSPKVIRELEGRGLIYTVGRSDGNYRLFDESALWCTRTITELRGLGLTLVEIERLHDQYRAGGEQPLEALFNQLLDQARARLLARVEELTATVARIDGLRGSIPGHFVSELAANDPCLERP